MAAFHVGHFDTSNICSVRMSKFMCTSTLNSLIDAFYYGCMVNI
jgi:hypothetical protein